MQGTIEQPNRFQSNVPGNTPGIQGDGAPFAGQPGVAPSRQPASSKGGYLLAGLCFVGAIVAFLITFVATFVATATTAAHQFTEMTMAQAPGTTELKLDQVGSYNVIVSPSSSPLAPFGPRTGTEVTLTLTEEATGQQIPVTVVPGSEQVSPEGAFQQFTIAEPGAYRLTAAYADGRTQPRTMLSISPDVAEKTSPIMDAYRIGMGLAALLFVAGLVIAFRAFQRNGGLAHIG